MTTPAPPDDDRDPKVAGWLAVEPLDDATRTRLVREAVDAAHPAPRRSVLPIVAAAAALLVAVLVAVAVLVPRSSDDTTVQATDAPATSPSPESAERESGSAAPDTAFSSPGSPRDVSGDAALDVGEALVLPSIGALGDVSTEARLRRAIEARLPPAADAPPVTATGCAVAVGRTLGTPIAAGTGRVDGRRAVVVVTEQPSGTTAVVAVRGAPCGDSVAVVIS